MPWLCATPPQANRSPRPRFSARGLLAEEDARVAPRLAGSERLRLRPVEIQEHRLLVAGKALRADRTLRRALFGKPAEADEREAATLKELRHQRQSENAPQAQRPRLFDAGVHESLPHPTAGRLRPHSEGADLGEGTRETGERAATGERVVS